MNQNILVVDDDREIVDAIEFYLRPDNFNVLKAYDGLEALDILIENDIKLIIMDVMMPNLDGLKTTLKIREKRNIPIILLSAKSEEIDKITGLNIGADDYVAKPFKPLELLARVNSQLRRYKKFLSMIQKNDINENMYTIGGLELDTATKEVSVDGKNIKTTPIEFKILTLLIKNPGRVFSADEIYEKVWKEKAVNTDTIMVHVRNIREKIEMDPKNPKYLKVVWGVGYKIEKQ
ncbi:MAG: response regulator transcription factor [Paeniclostridium sordellii]|nr:response regulator transcription factor [Paeniclostridium sordellii]